MGLIALLCGCASPESSKMPAQIKEARQRYESLTHGMTRGDVHRLLGEPQSTQADGTEQWTTTEGTYLAPITVKFGPEGTIVGVSDPGVCRIARKP